MSAPAANASQAELDKFGALANRWWDPHGPQRPLHELNPARLGYVRDRTPLRGARVVCEMESATRSSRCSSALTRLVLPPPEGADTTNRPGA